MAIDVGRSVPITGLALLVLGSPVGAQAPLFLVNPSTQVASVDFDFTSGQSFTRELLRSRIGLTDRGALADLRQRLAFLPLINAPEDHPFNPVELQKDLVRIRRLYAQSGFLDSDVRYEVELDTAANTLDVRFLITEGRPVLLDILDTRTDDGTAVAYGLPTELSDEWRRFEDRLRRDNLGRRMGPAQARSLRERGEAWLRDRGYPTPAVEAQLVVDSASARATALLVVEPGPRRRLGPITVEGNRELATPVLAREFPIREADWFSANALSEGERELYGLDMIRWADAQLAEGDSTGPVPIRVQVQEGPTRLVSGRLGYATSSGLTTQASWSHRNFLGGARVLTFSAEGRTGFLAADETSEKRYGLSATIRQPYLGSRRLSGLFTPFFEYRDGPIDESIRNGVDAIAVYELGGINNLSLQYRIAAREIFQYRFGTLTEGGLDFLALQAILDDSIGAVKRESRLTASGTWGSLDDRARPRRGFVSRVGIQGAGPDILSDVQFARI
ncbi:MAG: hypothetical protein OEO23_16785, partial [Gemmatimonadota bacterium]|nr:hypothetical protein [Gemmatimonadota bacterium]